MPDDVHIWYRPTAAVDPAAVAAATRVLSEDERARCQRYHFWEDRRDYAVAHDLLRAALSRHGGAAPCDWQFEADASGKPRLSGAGSASGLSFNLSHTRGFVACAVAPGFAVGVDVERVDRAAAAAGLAERLFSGSETAALARLSGSTRESRFIELWALKEAYLKALGVGLSAPLDTISFDLREGGVIGFECAPPDGAGGWRFALYAPSDDVRLAVAARPATAIRFIARDPGLMSALPCLYCSHP